MGEFEGVGAVVEAGEWLDEDPGPPEGYYDDERDFLEEDPSFYLDEPW